MEKLDEISQPDIIPPHRHTAVNENAWIVPPSRDQRIRGTQTIETNIELYDMLKIWLGKVKKKVPTNRLIIISRFVGTFFFTFPVLKN